MKCPYCEHTIDPDYITRHAEEMYETWLRKGDVIHGFCGGIFSRDSYGPRTVTSISADGVEALDHNLGPTLEGTLVDSRLGHSDTFRDHIGDIIACSESIERDGVEVRATLAEQLGLKLAPEPPEIPVDAPRPAAIVKTVPPKVKPGASLQSILIQTRGVLTLPDSWIQGGFAKRPETPTTKAKKEKLEALGYDTFIDCSAVDARAVSWSLEGAVLRATGGPGYDEAVAYLQQKLGVAHTEEWNDAPERTHEEVLAFLDTVIRELIAVPA